MTVKQLQQLAEPHLSVLSDLANRHLRVSRRSARENWRSRSSEVLKYGVSLS